MRVTGTHPQTPIARPDASRPKTEAARSGPVPTRAAAVRVSDVGKSLAAAKAPETPDAARVERLRALVEKGTLPIDSGAIADAMIREER